MPLPVLPDDIAVAMARIKPRIRRTPILEIAGDSFGTSAPIALKLELLQHTGSFKPRGAFNNLLSQAMPGAGVTAASGGNHGTAVAYAARELGHKARIFVPATAAAVKKEKIRGFGAELVAEGETFYDALALCEAYVAESGAFHINAYDSPPTLAGQGTIGLEWEEQNDADGAAPLDTVIVAVGGGGLIGGIAAWFGGRTKVIGVEPEHCCALHEAMATGHIVKVEVNSVAADSLGAAFAGKLVFEIAKTNIDRVVLVSDEAILKAQRMLLDKYNLLTEPGGATAFAALTSKAYVPAANERVGVLICGGNVDLATLVNRK